MSSIPGDSEKDIDTGLIDLSSVLLRVLREDNSATLRQAMSRVLEQNDRPIKTQATCSNLAGFD
jgi:hypothetical protein